MLECQSRVPKTREVRNQSGLGDNKFYTCDGWFGLSRPLAALLLTNEVDHVTRSDLSKTGFAFQAKSYGFRPPATEDGRLCCIFGAPALQQFLASHKVGSESLKEGGWFSKLLDESVNVDLGPETGLSMLYHMCLNVWDEVWGIYGTTLDSPVSREAFVPRTGALVSGVLPQAPCQALRAVRLQLLPGCQQQGHQQRQTTEPGFLQAEACSCDTKTSNIQDRSRLWWQESVTGSGWVLLTLK